MKKPKQKMQSGFTLIEILLYMALSTMMVALMGGIGVNVFSGFVKSKAAEELQYNTQFVTEKIRSTISQAEAITAPAQGESGTVLSLTMSDAAKDPTVIDVSEGRVRIREGAGAAEFISGDGVDVYSAEFLNVTPAESVGSVRAVLHMGLRNPEDRTIHYASSTIYTTVNLLYP